LQEERKRCTIWPSFKYKLPCYYFAAAVLLGMPATSVANEFIHSIKCGLRREQTAQPPDECLQRGPYARQDNARALAEREDARQDPRAGAAH
jgi:hypothetical protein